MLEVNRNPNIKLYTLAEIASIKGFVGNFEVEILQKARYTKKDCNGCGACVPVCPAIAPSEFDQGLGPRRAIYIAFSQAVPMRAQIDMNACIKCGNCAKVCELTAVDFEQQDSIMSVKVGGIIVATGWDEYEPELGYLGYGKYENVITQLTFERMLAPNGPVIGHIVRPSDGKHPESILFVNCVGSRDIKRNIYCSSGVCCMVSIKNAKLVKSHDPTIDTVVAYIDIRAAGKGYEEYFLETRKIGVNFVRSKVVRVEEDDKSRRIKVVLDNSAEPGKGLEEREFDLVVLSAAMLPSKTFKKLNQKLNLSTSPGGFLKEFHARLNTVDTDVPGIALAGAVHGPKAISETIMQSKGAASSIGKLLKNGEYRIKLIRAIADPKKCAHCGMCAEACPYSAIKIDAENGAIVDDILCRGCGLCANVCPGGAITIRYYRDSQYNQLIDALLEDLTEDPVDNPAT
jgi:heterodisulfide reductase subunit A